MLERTQFVCCIPKYARIVPRFQHISLSRNWFLVFLTTSSSCISIHPILSKFLRYRMAPWFRQKIVDPFLHILSRDLEPKQLAFSAAVGTTLGVFPICGMSRLEHFGFLVSRSDSHSGVPVFLCGMAIAVLGSLCHAPSVMLANIIATPMELSLVVPFLRLGEAISGGPHFALTSDALKKVITGQASSEVLRSIFNALLGWIVAAPFMLTTLHILFLLGFKMLVGKYSMVPAPSPKKPSASRADVRLKVRDV